jgi:outer membrane receptor protein involved in Fe transport
MTFAKAALLAGCATTLPAFCWAQSTNTGAVGQPPSAVGQSIASGDEAATVADIVVTARKSGETLLTAPATVSMVTARGLDQDNVTNANQINNIVPGFVESPSVSGGGSVTYRGLGSNASVFSLESSVPLYIDGVYLGHIRDYVTPLYDVDHIEFIAGTQSTLLGKNVSIGAVSVVNNHPTADLGMDVQYTHSFEVDGDRLEGDFNVPIAQSVLSRTSFLFSNEDGFLQNLYTSQREQQLRDLSGREEILFNPTPNTDITLIYQHDDRDANGQLIKALTDPSGKLRADAALLGIPDYPVGINDKTIDGSYAGVAGGVAGPNPFDDQYSNRLNLLAHQKLGAYTLTSQTAFVQWDSNRATDLDFLPANLYTDAETERNKEFTQEIRISSPTEWRFNYLAGVYYYYNAWELYRDVESSPSNTIGFPLNGDAISDFNETTQSVSAFASGRYDLFKNFTILGGARFTDEAKTATLVRNGTGVLGGPGGATPPVPFTNLPHIDDRPVDGDIGIEYHVDPNTLLYATYSKGSKSGGYQEDPTTVSAATFSGETAYTAEGGVKFNFHSRGYFTLAGYDTEVRGYQTSYTAPVGTPAVSVQFVGNSNIYARGFQAAGLYQLAPGLSADGSVVYSNNGFSDTFLNVAQKGDPLTKAPTWSGDAGLDFTRSLPRDLTLNVRPAVDFATSALLNYRELDPDAPDEAAHQIVNLKISVANAAQGWEIAFVGTNLLNQTYAVFATPASGYGSGVGKRAFYGAVDRPLVAALQISFKR